VIHHSKNSRDFVGLRVSRRGRKQIVCEVGEGRRVLLEISDPVASDARINEAMKEGIGARHVLGGVIAGLKARGIDFDFAN